MRPVQQHFATYFEHLVGLLEAPSGSHCEQRDLSQGEHEIVRVVAIQQSNFHQLEQPGPRKHRL